MNYDNPAGRLLALIEEGRKHKPDEICTNVWKQLLGTNEQVAMADKIGKIMQLPTQAIAQLYRHFPNMIDTSKTWSGMLSAFFLNHNLKNRWETFIAHTESSVTEPLKVTAALLHEKWNLPMKDELGLDSIKTSATDVLQEIENSKEDLEPSNKLFLDSALRELQIRIDEYRLLGSHPIQESISKIVIHIGYNTQAFEKNEKGKAIKEKIENLWRLFRDWLGLAADALQVIGFLKN